MRTILVTGAEGFVGKNLRVALSRCPDVLVRCYDVGNTPEELDAFLAEADLIYHLAGVNRPPDPAEFEAVNAGLTHRLCATLRRLGRAPAIVLSSSIQAALDNPYGQSKLHAEEELRRFAADTGASVVVFRFQNLFGKWCRPNYNSVVATFCHQIARDLPITISDPARELDLVYIDDAVDALVAETEIARVPGFRFAEVAPVGSITLGDLAETLRGFRALRTSLVLPPLDRFTRCLYATYLANLPQDAFAYDLPPKADNRGVLGEFVKSAAFGQIFVSRTYPGITRGNHYHHTKTEKFLVLEGQAVIRFRHILEDEVLAYHVSGPDLRVVDIPPGYTHAIENVGAGELVTLFWASEPFDPDRPDTVYECVTRDP
ncbi:MAG: polysaccharide biosynthesis C-terminal domain-containing protein [Anaerolineae bacterium]